MTSALTKLKSGGCFRRLSVALILSSAFLPALGGSLSLAPTPLFSATSANVYPNLMFLLDSSGSMAWDYVPDYINDSTSCFSVGANTGLTSPSPTRTIAGPRQSCYIGDPPFMSADFNTIYYNPDYTYTPGWNGSLNTQASYPAQSISNVTLDPYGQQKDTQLTSGNNGGSTIDLRSNYPDRAWCSGASMAITDVACKLNRTGYDYPDISYNYPPTSGGTTASSGSSATGRYILGAPYYWRILATEYCSDPDLKVCVDWTSTDPGTPPVSTGPADAYKNGNRYSNNKYCAGPDRTFATCQNTLDSSHRYPAKCSASDCAEPGSGSTYPFPAPVRFCKPDSTSAATTTTLPLLDCQGAYNDQDGHTVPKFLGYVIPKDGDVAIGDVTVGAIIPGQSITAITVAGANQLNSSYTVPFGATSASVAAAIKSQMSQSTYDITVSGATIRIASKSAGTADNNKIVAVSGPSGSTPGSVAHATISVPAAGSTTANYRLGPLCVGTINGSAPNQTCDQTSAGDQKGTVISSTTDVTADLSTATGQATAATAIATAINSYPSGGYSASASGNAVTVAAPTVGNMTYSINAMTVNLVDVPGTGMITVYGSIAGSKTYGVSAISVATTPSATALINTPIVVTGDMTTTMGRNAAATAIASAISGYSGTSKFSATSTNNVINIIASGGSAGNGLLSVTSAAAAASGTITINNTSSGIRTYKIASITVGSTVVASNIQFNADLSTTAGRNFAATQVKNAIGNGYFGSCAGGASCTNNIVTVTASTPGGAGNGAISISAPASTAPTVSVTLGGTYGGNSNKTTVTKISMTSCADTSLNRTNILSGTTSGATSANALATAIRSTTLVTGYPLSIASSGSTVTFTLGGYDGLKNCVMSFTFGGGGTPSVSPSTVTLTTTGNDAFPTTPTNASGGQDGLSTAVSGISGGISRVALVTSNSAFSGGTNASGTIPTVANPMDGGNASGSEHRQDVGLFMRCDITSTANCAGLGAGLFPKAATRTDCTNSTYCTYAEESTNFANWYAYYRTRMQAMKTAASLAFSGLDSTYRVGFTNIYTTSINDANFLRIDDFGKSDTNGQQQKWYAELFAQQPSGSTPLRSALARMGQMYAAKGALSGTDNNGAKADPVQYACQQNVTLLTTDGYWNIDTCSNVKQLDNSTNIGQQDGGPTNNRINVAPEMWDGDQGGSCLTGNSGGPSSVETLADVAYYYAHTDLRTGALSNCSPGSGTETDVCENKVSTANASEPRYQHMSTYTLGLGVSGTLRYQRDYDTANNGAFYDIKNGTRRWPQVSPNTLTTVDDLWHTAVNGFGHYFSAKNPALLRNNLADALSSIKSSVGSGAAAATSAQALSSSGGDLAFVASYKTQDWFGNLEARAIDPTTAVVSPAATWCVSDVAADASTGATACIGTLKMQVGAASDTRHIYLLDPIATTGNRLRDFTYDSLTAAERNYFEPCTPGAPINALSQCSLLPTPTKTAAIASSLINYLRGQNGMEMDSSTNTFQAYRGRKQVLGDVVSSTPLYVGPPSGSYVDAFYANYVSSQSTRAKTVFVGANDGMLHAFTVNADTSVTPALVAGAERWAYIPAQMLPSLRNLASDTYKTNHQFMINGPSVVGDVCFGDCLSINDWHTIVISGYGAGGRGYFAIDVTDPTHPQALWEIDANTDADLGYSFGNPIITKRPDGKWVVLLTSGYNNTSNGGSGKGVLFVVEPSSGRILTKISNNSGAANNPSGLSKIEALIPDATHDNTATNIYGGDLNGNIWRFNLTVGAESVVKVGEVADNAGTPQPITTKPILTTLDDSSQTPYVIVGTGLLLQTADKSDTHLQSIYGFAETYDSACAGDQTTPSTANCINAPQGYVTQYVYSSTVPVTVITTTLGTTSEVPSTIATVGNCGGSSSTTPPLPSSCPKGARNQLVGSTLVDNGQDNLGRKLRKTGATAGTPDKTPVLTGCYVDLPDSGERVNVDPILVNGELVVATNVPETSACSAGGHAYLNSFNYKTCQSDMSVEIANAMAVGLSVVKDAGGNYEPLITMGNNPTPITGNIIPSAISRFQGKRSGWRILGD